ncbi:MAG: hypothetical protein M1838_003050 [Thelocarpon superellum]|nr:MAG: hypothetical protein M1838_003050 [Thelocarpon superellum]
MASLDLKMGDPPGHVLTDKTFHILRDSLQPDTILTLKRTTESILDLVSEHAPLSEPAPLSSEVGDVGDAFIEMAEQIPHHRPAQVKLVDLLEELSLSPKLGIASYSSRQSGSEDLLHTPKTSIRDYDGINAQSAAVPEPEKARRFVNLMPLQRTFCTDPSWAIWAQRNAHETGTRHSGRDDEERGHEAYVMAAARWILLYRQSVFKQVRSPPIDVSAHDLRAWSPGLLYHGPVTPPLSLARWHVWRDSFRTEAAGLPEGKEGKGFKDEKVVV